MGRSFRSHDPEGRPPTRGFAQRATLTIGLLVLAVVLLWFAYKGLDILFMIFGGIVMAVLLHVLAEPIVRWTRMPLWAAVLVVVLLMIGTFSAAGWFLAPSVSQQFAQLGQDLPAAIDRVRAQLEQFGWTTWLMEKGADNANGQKVLSQATRVFSITMTAAAAIAIVSFLALYMAAQPDTYVNGAIRLFPVSFRPRAREVMTQLYRTLRIWLLTKLVSMAFVAVCVGVGLWLLKVPLALALAIVAGLLEFIPTIGPLLSAAPAMLLAFTHSPMSALYVGILYFAVQWIQNHVTNPLLQQRTLSLPPGVSLALVALLGALFGFGGLLLSGPLSIVVLVLVKMLYVEEVLERGRKRFADRDHIKSLSPVQRHAGGPS
ncbi:MAG TPA: AI-2E family transporter [Candidatus Acidoferrum sp.]|nr:AI-2E family transporter [Candidatus Acidoferrum sp.]